MRRARSSPTTTARTSVLTRASTPTGVRARLHLLLRAAESRIPRVFRGLDFETKILVKENAPELLRHELMLPSWKPQPLAISGVTDAFQPIERRLKLTRRCLEVLVEFRNPVSHHHEERTCHTRCRSAVATAGHEAALVFVSVTSLRSELARGTGAPGLAAAASTRGDRSTGCRGYSRRCSGRARDSRTHGSRDAWSFLTRAAVPARLLAGYVPLRLPFGLAPLFEEWLTLHAPLQKEKILNRVREIRGGRMNDPNFGSRLRGEGGVPPTHNAEPF